MKLSEVKKHVNTNKVDFMTNFCRKAGLYVTWILINVFPMITANFVTFSMFVLQLTAIGILYYAILTQSIVFIIVSLLIFNFAYVLDCVDGNIARIKKKSSVYGIIMDRSIHNIIYPLFYTVIGFYFLLSENNVVIFSMFLLAGLLTELNPIEIAIDQTKNRIYEHNLKNIDTKKYKLTSLNINYHQKSKKSMKTVLYKIIKAPPFLGYNNMVYFALIIDILILDKFQCNYIFVFLYTVYFIIYKLLTTLLHLKKGHDDIVDFNKTINK